MINVIYMSFKTPPNMKNNEDYIIRYRSSKIR